VYTALVARKTSIIPPKIRLKYIRNRPVKSNKTTRKQQEIPTEVTIKTTRNPNRGNNKSNKKSQQR